MLRAFLNFDCAGVPSLIWSSLMHPAKYTVSSSQTSFNNHCAKCSLTVTKSFENGFFVVILGDIGDISDAFRKICAVQLFPFRYSSYRSDTCPASFGDIGSAFPSSRITSFSPMVLTWLIETASNLDI